MAELKLKVDRTGFPMIWIEEIEAFMHWLPITKIQFEYFLCDSSDSHFDARWYDEVLALNSRITPKEIRANNYWKTFLTGVTPDEIERFAHWCGENYSVINLEDWFATYQALMAISPLEADDILNELTNISSRTKTLLTRMDLALRRSLKEVGYDRTLADQMLMRMGVMEWVHCPNNNFQWGGMGETSPNFYGNLFTPDSGHPSIPTDPEVNRMYYYGFRLIWRDE